MKSSCTTTHLFLQNVQAYQRTSEPEKMDYLSGTAESTRKLTRFSLISRKNLQDSSAESCGL